MHTKGKNQEDVKEDLAAIILSAGYSSRMKAFKPLLPLGKTTVIEHAIHTFLQAGVKNIIVVIGYQAKKLKPILEEKHIKWVYNEEYDAGMYASVLAGVKALPAHIKGLFLLPVDIPLVQSHTIEHLTEVFVQKEKYIIYPTFHHRKGHPPLISYYLFSEILDYDGQGGLKTLLRRYEDQAEYVEVEDEAILLDMDVQEEYEKLCDRVNPVR